GAAVADDAPGRAEDLDAHAGEDRPEFLVAAVDPSARLAHAVDLGDEALAIGAIFQVEPQGPGWDGLDFLEVPDVALVAEHPGDSLAQARGGHLDEGALDADRVADPGEHVGDRVGHHVGEGLNAAGNGPTEGRRRDVIWTGRFQGAAETGASRSANQRQQRGSVTGSRFFSKS